MITAEIVTATSSHILMPARARASLRWSLNSRIK